MVENPQTATAPEESRRVEFEIWARPPAVKMKVAIPAEEVRVSDGEWVYTLLRRPEGDYEGRRRRLTAGNLYHALPVAAVIVDAATGYANLAASVKFVPTTADPRFEGKSPPLKWFQLEPAVLPPHHLLAGVRTVKVGIGADDGLVRALVARGEKETKGPVSIVVLETVKKAELKAEDLTLPPEAAGAKWRDRDTDQPIAAPAKLIVPAKS
jgi:hypothetical protein